MLARQIAFGFGIAVIFPLLVYYGVSTFYAPPKWQDFQSSTPLGANSTPEERREYADNQRRNREAHDVAAKNFARVMVLVATPLGIAAILFGAYAGVHAVGTGLILGGIAAVACGYYGYWSYLDDWIRFVSLLVAFVILVIVGWRLFPPRARSA
jgi:hypothetical protein